MPLDLVGKLHRTVYITNCPDGSEEDLLQLMQQRCGPVEAWDVVENRLVVVFQSVNSISTATAFNGMAFVDLTKHLVVWCARDPPPSEAPQQLAIAGGSPQANHEDDSANEAREQERAERQRKQALIQELLGKEAERLEMGAASDREANLRGLCYRQLKALCVLTQDAIARQEAELAKKKEHLSLARHMLSAVLSTSSAAFTTAPPVKQHRAEA